MNRTLVEAAFFASACCALALVNVLINPTALDLGTNYAPRINTDRESILAEHEFHKIDGDELSSYIEILFDEHPYVMVLDARSSADYEIAHIPGAHLADHYHQQQYLEPLIATLQDSPIVVVYCKGGDCEDSIFLARDLVYKYDVAKDSLYIYEGGMNDWQQRNLATTSGEQR